MLSSLIIISVLIGCSSQGNQDEVSKNVSIIDKDEEKYFVSIPINIKVMKENHEKEIQRGVDSPFGNCESLDAEETKVELQFDVENIQEESLVKVEGTIFYKEGSFNYNGEGIFKEFTSPDTGKVYFYGDIEGTEGFNFLTMFSVEDNRAFIQTPVPVQLGEYKGFVVFGENFGNKQYWDAFFKQNEERDKEDESFDLEETDPQRQEALDNIAHIKEAFIPEKGSPYEEAWDTFMEYLVALQLKDQEAFTNLTSLYPDFYDIGSLLDDHRFDRMSVTGLAVRDVYKHSDFTLGTGDNLLTINMSDIRDTEHRYDRYTYQVQTHVQSLKVLDQSISWQASRHRNVTTDFDKEKNEVIEVVPDHKKLDEKEQQLLLQKTEEIYELLEEKNSVQLADYVHPTKGLQFAIYEMVENNNLIFSPEEVKQFNTDETVYSWGINLGVRDATQYEAIPNNFIDDMLTNSTYTEEPAVNVLFSSPGLLNYVFEAFPSTHNVLYRYKGSEPGNWQNLQFVYQYYVDDWYLSAIVHHTHIPYH
jgi:hypothetical protein